MTATEWYIQEMFKLNPADYKSKRGYLGKRKQIEKLAKEMEEQKSLDDYIAGYQKGWTECDENIKQDIKHLYHKYKID